MIRRETSPSLVNAISNLAGVHEHIAKDGRVLDWSAVIDHLIVASNGVDAVAVFEETEPGRWQAHTLFAPSCRGARAIEAGRAFLAWAFDNGCTVVWGATPLKNAKARWFNRKCGAKVTGVELYPSDGLVELFEVRKGDVS